MLSKNSNGVVTTCEHWSAGGHCAERGCVVSSGVCRACRGFIAPRPVVPREPSMMDMGISLATDLAAWAKAGFPVAGAAQLAARKAACLACDHWHADARAGLGKCDLCGCCSVKWWLASSRCKIDRWPTVDTKIQARGLPSIQPSTP